MICIGRRSHEWLYSLWLIAVPVDEVHGQDIAIILQQSFATNVEKLCDVLSAVLKESQNTSTCTFRDCLDTYPRINLVVLYPFPNPTMRTSAHTVRTRP